MTEATTSLEPAAAPEAPAPEAPAAPATTVMSETPSPPADAQVDASAVEGEAPSESEAQAETPIVYELSLPENFQVDKTALTELQTLAAEAKLPPEQAQHLVNLHVKATESFIAAQQKAFSDLQTQWTEQVNALPDFATPAAREASLRSIAAAIDEFGSPEVRSAFDMTGAGNNPHIVSMVLKMAKALSEGAPIPQGKPTANPRTPTESLSERLYPSQGN